MTFPSPVSESMERVHLSSRLVDKGTGAWGMLPMDGDAGTQAE